jgi:hypothetical protein
MWKLKFDKGISEFLSSDGRAVNFVGLIILGLALVLIGSFTSGSGGENNDSVQTGEAKIEQMCSMIDGVGECRVMMTYRPDSEEVYAVLVLCDGAESVFVREKIISLFTSLYGIGSHRVEIDKLYKK